MSTQGIIFAKLYTNQLYTVHSLDNNMHLWDYSPVITDGVIVI